MIKAGVWIAMFGKLTFTSGTLIATWGVVMLKAGVYIVTLGTLTLTSGTLTAT